jgi:branched-chain amino acid transport system ATP-binding protein
MSALLQLSAVETDIGGSRILRGVSLEVNAGEVVALMGRNGVGKTTTLKSITGVLPVRAGTITFDGQPLNRMSIDARARAGIGYVPQGRDIFPHLTIEENLLTGAFTRKASRSEIAADLERVYGYFPRLKVRRKSQSGYTSGGEQQMTAVGRALMARPDTIQLDEPSMGLAPQIVEEIFEIVKDLNTKEKVTFLLAEQNTNMALRYADYGYILENGRIVMDGEAKALRENEDVKEFYLGMGGGDRKSFRDVKSYKRRKRWLS